MSKIRLRPEVRKFAEFMEIKLRENEDKGGWDDCDPFWLLWRTEGEIKELRAAMLLNQVLSVRGADSVRSVILECADVANFAMMIADLAEKGKSS